MKKPEILPAIDTSHARNEITPEVLRNEARIFSQPMTLDIICSFVAGGGALTDLCDSWGVRYGEVSKWINQDDTRRRQFFYATDARKEWAVEKMLKELRTLALSDIRKLYDDRGAILPPDKWPDEIAKAVEAVKVDELYEYDEDGRRQLVGQTTQVKLWSKTKAMELLGKHLHMFLERIELSANKSLEDLIAESYKEKPKADTD